MFVSKFTFTFDCHELLNHFWTVKLFMPLITLDDCYGTHWYCLLLAVCIRILDICDQTVQFYLAVKSTNGTNLSCTQVVFSVRNLLLPRRWQLAIANVAPLAGTVTILALWIMASFVNLKLFVAQVRDLHAGRTAQCQYRLY